jgi:hypothetical protein
MRSGESYGLRLGATQRQVVYEYHRVTAADLAIFEALLVATNAGVEPFYLDRTDDGNVPLYVRIAEQLSVVQDRKDPKALGPSYTVRLSMTEEIA